MGRKNRNCKKVKDRSEISDNLKSKSDDAYKNDNKRCNIVGMKEVEVKPLQDTDALGKYKFEKNDVPYSVHSKYMQDISSVSSADSYENDDETACFTSDVFKPILQSQNNLERKTVKENFFSSVNRYKNSKAAFFRMYHKWLPERKSTLEKLRSLLNEVHDNTTNYYKTQATFKEVSYNSRRFKETAGNQAMDFFASFAAFVSDAASGVTSFAQAFQIDSYQTKLQEIIDHDAEITKDLYTTRSLCVSQYEGIEEVIRKFNPNTLNSTVDKISDTLLVHKHWAAIKNAYEEDNMSKLLDEVSKFFDNACQSSVLENVGASVSRFVADNPAALEACKSTGKAVYGAIDTFSEKKRDRNAAIGYVNKATNLYLMLEDKNEVDHLKSIINEDTHKSKLEYQIEEAIDSLEDEMKEMENIYFRLYNGYDSD